MLQKIKKWFSKDDGDILTFDENKNIEASFILKVDNLPLGILKYENNEWIFKYTDEFKTHKEYTKIVGFPDLDKEYRSDSLWPFFLIRIPGLKQPAIQEILKKENIDEENEVALLKRFGKKTISNPYELSY